MSLVNQMMPNTEPVARGFIPAGLRSNPKPDASVYQDNLTNHSGRFAPQRG